MTSLVSYIRDFLHDPNKDRWNDTRLLYLINRAQVDIAKRTKLLKRNVQIETRPKVGEYNLPEDYIEYDKVSLGGCNLCYNKPSCNSCLLGTPKGYYIENKKLYLCPIPTYSTLQLTYNTSGSVGIHSNIVGAEPSVGILVGFVDIPTDGFGILRTIDTTPKPSNIISLAYRATPKSVADIEDIPEVQEESAIKYYVCGHLLRSDKDSNSRSLGKEELMLYEQEIARITLEVRRANTNNTANITTGYRRM